MRLLSMTVPTVALSVVSSGAPPDTSTVCGDGPDLQVKVNARNLLDLQFHALADLALEAPRLRFHVVNAWRDRGESVIPGAVRRGRARDIRLGVRYRYGGAHDDGVAGVRDLAGNLTGRLSETGDAQNEHRPEYR